jgi:FAD/FMN-containing dehydrogenase
MIMTTEQEIKPETPTSDDIVLHQLVELLGSENASDTELERLVYSGDPSSLPQYHYRWKYHYLAEYVARVKTVDDVQGVLKIASDNKKTVNIRGGASSCMGSSSPTRGGITIDMKPMSQILEVNSAEEFVRVEPGVTFEQLTHELSKKDVMLGIYPSSALSAVIGGWIGCGGGAGIGTPKYGSLIENILELKVVRANGEVSTVTGDEIGLHVGAYGILGVIVEAKLKIRKKTSEYTTFSYGFDNLKDVCESMQKIAELEPKPVYLKIADRYFQTYSNTLRKGMFLLTITYDDEIDSNFQDVLGGIISVSAGEYLGEEFSSHEWDLRYDCEFNPKEHCESLMFQEIWTTLENVHEILEKYEEYRKSHKVPAIWFGMLGTSNWMRLELYGMLDPDQYLKFIGSKGILHKMVKKSIALGGGPYTIGLQNSIYMKRAYPERLTQLVAAKEEWDPHNTLNPDRVVSCLTSYLRINILFAMAAGFRRLASLIMK